MLLAGGSLDNDTHLQFQRDFSSRATELEQLESALLIESARRLSVEIPSKRDKPGWWSSDQEPGMPDYAVTDWLSDTGRIGAAKLIRQERRTNAEWWVKIVTPLLAALISLLGLVVALVTVSRK